MAKVNAPLMSLDARGQVGKAIVFSIWKGINYVRGYTVPKIGTDSTQVDIREIYHDASIAWKDSDTVGAIAIDAAYKLAYNTAAAGTPMSGFNLFMRQVVALNLTGTPLAYDGTLEIPTGPTA